MDESDVASASALHASYPWTSSDSPEEDESAIEQNDVLQFLLGKTPTIQTSNSISVISTNTHDSLESVDHIGVEKKALKIQIESVSTVSKAAPEQEPVSETDSDDDVFASTDTSVMLPNQPTCDLVPHDAAIQEHPVHDDLNQRSNGEKPEMQPEDEDMNVSNAELRQRRVPPSKDRPRPASPQTDKPARRLPPQLSSWLDSLTILLSTQRDLLYVALVLCVLFGYCVAIVYRAVNPISYPLPNVDALFKPYDVSNVSARFRSPEHGQSFTDAVMVEWEITNFPVDALHMHGPEPFEYRVWLDEQLLLFDVGVWSIEDDEDVVEVVNKTIGYRLRARDIPGLGPHALRLEVTFPIPGSDDELLTLSDTTTFTFSPPDSTVPHLAIKSPVDGATIEGRSFVLEYVAHNIQRLHVVLDRKWRMHKEHVNDGNLLLRGLGDGPHSIRLEAFDGDGALVGTQEIQVELVEGM